MSGQRDRGGRRRGVARPGRPPVLLVLVGLLAAVTSSCANGSSTSAQADDGPRPAVPKVCPGAARGAVSTVRFSSEATRGPERYRVYQPPGTAPTDAMALLVLLHGASADETQWLDVGITSAADCLIASGEMKPMVIVVVDGSRVEQSRATASPSPMERLVTDEILPAVRRTHPHLAGRAATSIGGISLGGGWALRIAAHRPDLFSAVGGHSPAAALDPAGVRSLAAADVRVWLDVGRSDGLAPRVAELAGRFRQAHVQAMVRSWPGSHDRRYWSQHTEDYLRFYAQLW